ncbi:molybdopterin converting factor subunit 1 [Bacillus sp. ISL-4]|uniref:molybdopterin converting factor subunit 1 n=1 Tax=unclassified Bacillus (in: firmicutes) TaxID=185979 RepID=UPI001BEC3C4B|nr:MULTISPECIES: molybdopterin converting factor subunit 1 [unclassified Bacillus (in: firmicutes)]MBT2671337.1 molybdopterin converting factor subunit 1 [Streptomyces sp. ISL-14]MBT2613913.1 molybdopterin converting factor subunit 1 [Bacillus sp. ISL-78]MBT2627792.1 molybdopterin converting factor subunit 1 [Bacillus sp. ISL-101]MBT2668993.1 molybdopterin converting factor subunit 1 [Bacillus sp. ISL-4]MBT2717485.1 molybdopterin converting factor subunit 1 [Bacillus sp. ISL-57]
MITVLFFAGIREEIGVDRLQIDIQNITVQQLKQYLQTEYQLSTLHQVMSAVNESFVTDDEVIKDQDTIAFIPPVSGG